MQYLFYLNMLLAYLNTNCLTQMFLCLFKRFKCSYVTTYIAWVWHDTPTLHGCIFTHIFDFWLKYYNCLHKPNHVWRWVVNTQVASLVMAETWNRVDLQCLRWEIFILMQFIFIKLYELTNLVLTF